MAEAKHKNKTYACESCAGRARAEANPDRILSRLWRWHTTWCPGWRAYQKHLAARRT